MEKVITALEVLLPIAVSMMLGVLARRRGSVSRAGVDGLQQFVVKFALPFTMFNSCLTGRFSSETLLPMVLTFCLLLISTVTAFRLRKKVGYSNLPMAFAAGEAGLLGLPLYMTLFPPEHTFRFAALQLIQLATVVPTISILTAERAGDNLTPRRLLKNIFTTPLFVGSLCGLAMNVSGAMDLLVSLGLDTVLTRTTSFLASPISAIILFVIGYTFDLSGDDLRFVSKVCAVQFALFTLYCLILQGALFLLPDVAAETRWAVLLYCLLPAPYLMPPLGKNPKEQAFASGLCSMGTVVTMAVFCVMTVLTR